MLYVKRLVVFKSRENASREMCSLARCTFTVIYKSKAENQAEHQTASDNLKAKE